MSAIQNDPPGEKNVASRVNRVVGAGVLLIALIGIGAAGFATRDAWMRSEWWSGEQAAVSDNSGGSDGPPVAEVGANLETLRLNKHSRRNLRLTAAPARVQDYWRTLQIPGMVVDRPGETDRGVTSPVEGVVEEVHAFSGDIVQPGDKLFTLRLVSENLQNTQSELFQATQEVQLLGEQLARLESAARSGALAESRLIEFRNQVRRQETRIQGYRQELRTRGFTPPQIAQAAEGNFLSTIEVAAPPAPRESPAGLEVQELIVGLGQQVQAGQLLATLANHQELYIEGHAFRNEAPYLAQAAAQGWEIEIEFAEDAPDAWPPLDQKFEIRHLSNSIDPASRTLAFYIALRNQSHTYQKDGKTFLSWRFRPGQPVRLFVPVEKFEDVLVVPSAGVVREGPEAFVFRQNGDLFDRISVHVLHEDRRNVVLENDGSIRPGLFLAQNAAASLNRVLKAQAASGIPADMHVHADGTVHAPH